MVFFKKWLLTLVILLSYSYPSLVFAQTEDSLKVGSSSQKILFAEQDTFSKISCVRDGSGIGRISFGKKFEKLNNPKDFILKIKSSSKNKETNTSKKIAFAKRCLKPLKTFSKIVKQAKKNNKKSQFKISPLLSVSAPVLTAVLPDPMTFENPNSSGLFPVKFTGENFQAPFSGDIQTPFSILLVESAGNVFPYPFKLNNSSEIEVETIAVSDAVVKVMVVTVIGKTTLFSNPLSVVLTGDNSQPDLDFAKPSILGISADPVIANSSSNYEFSLDVLNAYPSSSLTTAFFSSLFVHFGNYILPLPFTYISSNSISESVPALAEGAGTLTLVNYDSKGNHLSSEAFPIQLFLSNESANAGDGDNSPPDLPGGNGDSGNTTLNGGQVNVPLKIQEVLPVGNAGIARSGAIATFGIPFAKNDQVGLVNGRPALAVQNSNSFQFRTLATWPDGYVKWALVDTRADVPAGGTNTALAIVAGGGRSDPNDLAFDDGSKIIINTGKLTAQISKGDDFNIFDKVWDDGVLIVSSGSSGIGGTSVDGTKQIKIKPGTVSVSIEENGPTRAVVRADGTLKEVGGIDLLDFTCRIIARVGSNDMQIDFTLRNANINRPNHVVFGGIGLGVNILTGANAVAKISRHDGIETIPLTQSSDTAFLHMARTAAYTYNSVPVMEGQDGYEIVKNGIPIKSLGNQNLYPLNGYADLSGVNGGVTMAYKFMPFQSPASLEVSGSGEAFAGLFSARHAPDKVWSTTWRQHESRTVVFSFHNAQSAANILPSTVAKTLDLPVAGRAADYLQYDRAKVLPYRLVSVAEENEAFAAMGINHTVSIKNDKQMVMRWLYAHETGGDNNYDSIEKKLGGEWLRQGFGGQYLTALDLALYKSEWQILRSDNFLDKNDPGANNPSLPHVDDYQGDYEHRYRDGIILAYYLTGDERFKSALFDDAEILNHLYFYAQERGMAQSLRAISLVGEFTGDQGGALKAELKDWAQQYLTKIIDTSMPDPYFQNWGWQAPPGQGDRRYFVTNVGSNGSCVNTSSWGNVCIDYGSRGFFAASLSPLAYYHTARWLGTNDPQGALARTRMCDISYYAGNELYSKDPNPAKRLLAYVYSLDQTQGNKGVVTVESGNFHPIMLGMGECYKDTGDTMYLEHAIRQFEGFAAQNHGGGYPNDLYTIESRLDVQNFLRTFLDFVHAL